METIGLILSLLLTLMVLSYIFGENPLFKLAEHIFVGVSVGYAVLVGWYLVLSPALFQINPDESTFNLVTKLPPAILAFLLVFKVRPNQTDTGGALGSIALAFLGGVGAAVAIAGGLLGTLFPQTMAVAGLNLSAANPAYADAPAFWLHNQFLSNIVIIIGTIGTLFYFTFTQRPQGFLSGIRSNFVSFWAGMGRWIVLITLGALFANTVSARVALLVSRIQFLADGFRTLIGG